jgi:hypothetical protein
MEVVETALLLSKNRIYRIILQMKDIFNTTLIYLQFLFYNYMYSCSIEATVCMKLS